MAEAEDLKFSQCPFESDRGYMEKLKHYWYGGAEDGGEAYPTCIPDIRKAIALKGATVTYLSDDDVIGVDVPNYEIEVWEHKVIRETHYYVDPKLKGL